MTIIGIDISKHWLDAAWQQGNGWCCQRYETTPSGLRQLLKDTPADSHYVLEATGNYHVRTATAVYAAGRCVSVVNPLVIRRFAQMQLRRAKTDSHDAHLIATYGQERKLRLWRPRDTQLSQLGQLDGYLDDLIKQRTRLVNQYEAHRQQACPDSWVRNNLREQLRTVERRIKTCQKRLHDCVKVQHAAVYERLISIPGIGPLTAIKLIVDTHGFTRFAQVKQLVAYAGLSSRVHQSGQCVNTGGPITKMGAGRLRQRLYLCSWSAKRCNPTCARLAQRLRQKGKPAKVINIAVAHKLLRQAFAVATKQVCFSAEFA